MTQHASSSPQPGRSAPLRAVGCILVPIAAVLTIAYWGAIRDLPWYWQAGLGVAYLWLLGTLRSPEDGQRSEGMHDAMARTLSQQGRHEEALQAAEETLRREPDSAEALYIKALSLYHRGDAAQAERVWEEVLARDPSHWLAANNLGSVCLNRGEYLKSARYYKIASELRETDETIMENLGQVLGALSTTGRKYELRGNHAEALKYAQAIVELRPDFHMAYAFRGVQYAELGQLEKALQDFRKCLEIEPSYDEARKWLVRLGQTTSAPKASTATPSSAIVTLKKRQHIGRRIRGSSIDSSESYNSQAKGSTSATWSKGEFVFGRYEVQRQVGDSAKDEVGAMGTIYVCRDRGSERTRDVILKIVNMADWENPDVDQALSDFHLETSRWRALGSHPNLVELIGVEEYDGNPVLVMEHVFGVLGVGTTLRHWLNKKGVLPIDLAARWIGEVCNGVDHIHKVGNLVHCDLKPANLFIDGGGHLKVSDLGIACKIGEPARGGTRPYMAPEQFELELSVDQRTDIYALGVILFESLCGRRPLPPGDEMVTDLAWAYYHQNVPPRPPRDLRPAIPERLGEVMLRCLEKRPEDRFETPRELRQVLAAWAPELRARP